MKRFTLLMLVIGLIASAQAQETTKPPANAGAMSMEQGGMMNSKDMKKMMGNKDMKKMMKECTDMMAMMSMMQGEGMGSMIGDKMGGEKPSTNE